MLKLNNVMIGSSDSKTLAGFYEKVLQQKPSFEDGGWYGFDFSGFVLSIGMHDKVKGQAEHPERIILNFETTDVKGEFQRIKALGAKVIAEPYGSDEGDMAGWIATFADPEGNYFQLMTPWEG